MGMRLRTGLGLSRGRVLGAGVAETPWPYSFNITQDLAGFGSSTMDGGARTPVPFKWIETDSVGGTYYGPSDTPPASGGVLIANRGVGGTTATTVAAAVAAAAARLKASNVIFQLGGNYEAGVPVPTIVTKAAEMAASLGHSRFMHVPKHNDNANIAVSGALDWHRLRELNRQLSSAYPGRVNDAALYFRNYATGVPSDDDEQALDQVPPSIAADAAHLNGADGNRLLARECYAPWVEAMEGGLPFIPHQHLLSTAGSTNQSNGGVVGTVLHDSSISGTLTGATVSIVGNSNFSAAIESGNIVIRRATATLLTAGYYTLQLKVVKAGKSRISFIRVYLGDGAPTGAYRTNIAAQTLCREGQLWAGVQDSQRFSFAVGIKPLAGWDWNAVTNNVTHGIVRSGTSGGHMTIEVKPSANMNMGCTLRNSAGTTIFSLDSPTAQKFDEASGLRWYFCSVDFVAGVYAVATDANAAVTTGATFTASATVRLYTNVASVLAYLFATSVGSSSPFAINGNCPMELAAIWMSPDYVDFSHVSTNRDKVRDPVTKASILGTTRGGDGPGVVGGAAPVLWMEGPAGNLAAGLNLADTTRRWDASDRAMMASVAA